MLLTSYVPTPEGFRPVSPSLDDLLHEGLPSTFEDFKQIMDIVLTYLWYEITVFGVKTSIFNCIICSLILGIVISTILRIFLGSD